MSKWDGRYENTKESNDSIEKKLLDITQGKMCYPTSDGGTVRQTDDRIDIYFPSDSSKGHSHDGYDRTTGEVFHHD